MPSAHSFQALTKRRFSPGKVLSATPGLWAVDTAGGTLAKSYQWHREGNAVPGATAETYSVVGTDLATGVSVTETLADGFGQRSAESMVFTGMPAFTPAADTGLLGWFDAADAATITDVSGAVAEWADKAGGAALTQTSSLFRPVTGQRTQNGLNILDCQGSAFMTRADVLPSSGDIVFHGVFVVDAVTNAFETLVSVDATIDFQVDAGNASQFDDRLTLAGAGESVSLAGGPFSGAVVLSILFDRTATGTAEVYVSDTLRGQTGYTTSLDNAVNLYIMTNRTQNAYLDGAICELALTRTLTNRAEYHAYLAAKWGVA